MAEKSAKISVSLFLVVTCGSVCIYMRMYVYSLSWSTSIIFGWQEFSSIAGQ